MSSAVTVVGARRVFAEGLRTPIRIRVDGDEKADRDGGVKVETAESFWEGKEAL